MSVALLKSFLSHARKIFPESPPTELPTAARIGGTRIATFIIERAILVNLGSTNGLPSISSMSLDVNDIVLRPERRVRLVFLDGITQ